MNYIDKQIEVMKELGFTNMRISIIVRMLNELFK